MLPNHVLNRLNRMLGDHPRIGYAPDVDANGKRQPMYKWVWTPALTYPGQTGTRIIGARTKSNIVWMPDFGVQAPVFEFIRQYDDDGWALALWTPPESPEDWALKYPELKWPAHGLYLMTDIFIGMVEPTEALTLDAIGAICEQRVRNLQDFKAMAQGNVDRAEAATKSVTDAMIDDACMEYDSIPGTRGGATSWGGTEKKEEVTI